MNYKIKRKLNIVFLFVFCFFSFVVTTTAQTYTVVDIGTLGGVSSIALDLNENGYVVGNSQNADLNPRGFVYKIAGDTKTAIGTFGGEDSYANAINNNNRVVGKAANADGYLHAFLYDIATGTLTDLHSAVSLGGLQSSAVGINDSGLIVGWAELADGNARGFVYNPATGVRTEIGTFGGALSVAFDINNNNIVAGMAQVSDTVTHVFNYNVASAVMTDMGTLGGNDIEAGRINNSNLITGSSKTSASGENFRGFRASGTAINPAADTLPTLGGANSIAIGLNDNGDVVGQADRTDGLGKAFLFRNNIIKDLNTTISATDAYYWKLSRAMAINNFGQIVGNGVFSDPNSNSSSNNRSKAILLLPKETAATYTINGQITSNGNALSDVTVSLSGSATASTTTDLVGNYSFANLTAGGYYTVAPTLANNTFTPPSSTFNNLSSNQTANFTSTTTPTPTPTPNLADQSYLDSTYAAGVTESFTFVRTTAVQTDGKILVGGTFSRINGAPRRALERFLTDGTRDADFNGGGSGVDGDILHIALQSNGKILIGGSFYTYNYASVTRNIVRLNSDGTLDSTFNGGTGANGYIQKVVIQSDGKILIGGAFTTYNGIARNRVARLNADGSPDTTFDPGSGANKAVDEIAVQPNDGKIIVGGDFSTFNGAAKSAYVRLNQDGSIDANFNIGTGATELDNKIPQVLGIALQADGKILLGGAFAYINGTDQFGLVRLNPDGSVDTSFTRPFGAYVRYITVNANGKILIGGGLDYPNNYGVLRLNGDGSIDTSFQKTKVEEVVSEIAIQSDGKMVLGGSFTKYGDTDRRYLVRVNSDGSLDPTLNVRVSQEGTVRNIVSQPDGKNIVTGNFLFANGVKRSNIARFNADGSLDESFVPGYTPSYQPIDAAAVQSDGKILIGGVITSYGGVGIKRLARLNADGSLDTTFNNALLPTPPEVGFAQVLSIKIQPDGKILVGGTSINAGGASRHFNRLNPDGSLDTNFNVGTSATSINSTVYDIEILPDGKILVTGPPGQYQDSAYGGILRLNYDGTRDASSAPGTGANADIRDAAIQSDGKIIIAGGFNSFNGISRSRIARLNADGSLDTSFDTGSGTNGYPFSIIAQPNGKVLIGGSFSTVNGTASRGLARLSVDGTPDTTFESRFQNDAYVQKVHQQADGKIVFGGRFNLYAGVARNSLARLTETAPSSSVATPTGQSIVVSTPAASLNYSSVTTAGNTVITAMSANQLQPLPSGYILPAGTPIYDITTTAVFSGGITVTLRVPNVADATACSLLRILHYTNNAWDDSNNATPSYDSATGVCTVLQTVTSLSPFVVAQINSSSYNVSGQVIYGNTPAGQASKFISGVNLSAGSSTGSAVTDGNGYYQLTGLSNVGSHTVTPSKSGDVNGINSTDAVRIQQYIVGSVAFTPNQLAAADTSNNGVVNSTDALRIQQYVVQTPAAHVVGQWKFLPASKNYSSLNANLSAENYTAILMGEVSGNWSSPTSGASFLEDAEAEFVKPDENNQPVQFEIKQKNQLFDSLSAPQAGVTVALPTDARGGSGTTVTIPIDVSQLPELNAGNRVETYNFNVQFNANVLSNPVAAATGTLSAAAGGSLVTGTPQAGVFSVSYTNPNGITGAGTLLNIQFTVNGTSNQQTAITFVGTSTSPAPFEFNDGDPAAMTNTGQFTVTGTTAASVAISGRVMTESGRGIRNVRLTLTDLSGNVRTARTTAFGYYRFADVAAGETYIISAFGKSYTFSQPSQVLNISGDLTDINFTGYSTFFSKQEK